MEHNLGNMRFQEERSGRMLIRRPAVGPLTGARMPTRLRAGLSQNGNHPSPAELCMSRGLFVRYRLLYRRRTHATATLHQQRAAATSSGVASGSACGRAAAIGRESEWKAAKWPMSVVEYRRSREETADRGTAHAQDQRTRAKSAFFRPVVKHDARLRPCEHGLDERPQIPSTC
jgi:hypothetical protein